MDGNASPHLLESILRWCESAAPEPWYAKLHATQHGIDRDSLDPPLTDLRVRRLIRLTDWLPGKGQGYLLTDEGKALLADSKAMAALRRGQLPEVPAPAPVTDEEEEESVFDSVEPAEEPPAVRNVLVVVNCVMFMGGLAVASQAGLGEDYVNGVNVVRLLDDLGALYGPRLLQGEWWRLLTSCFLHNGWQHLAMNMLTLYLIGASAERMWGHWGFLILFLVSGLGGSCLSAAWQPLNPVVGASGALFGVFAGQAAWLLLNRSRLPEDLFAQWLRNVVIITAFLILLSMGEGVAWLAHLGGALTGVLVAILLHVQAISPLARVLAGVGLVLLPVGLVGLVLIAMQTTQEWQRIRMPTRLVPVAQRSGPDSLTPVDGAGR
jgi:rhomboid protease GluP